MTIGLISLKLEFLTVSRDGGFLVENPPPFSSYSFSELREPISMNFAALESSVSLLFRTIFFGGLFHVSIVENPRKIPLSPKILDFRPDFLIFMVQFAMNMVAYPSKTAGNRF